MALNANDVIAATEQPAPAAGAPAPTDGGQAPAPIDPAAALETLPEEVINMPWIFDVAKGQPAAVSDAVKSKDPDYKTVIKFAQPLVAAGFGLYKSIDGKKAVIFNLSKIGADQIQEADQAGKLDEIAPPLDQVRKSSKAAPEGAAPGQPAAAAGPAPMVQSQPAPSVQTNLATKRVANLTPGGPTSGPSPGSGRILNSILKSAV